MQREEIVVMPEPNNTPTDQQITGDGGHLLEVSDLHVEFRTSGGVVKAVNGVNYTLDEGETLAILGESGSGKSVGVEAVMGIVESPPGFVTAGSVKFRGTELREMEEARLCKIRGHNIAMIFQEPQATLDPGFKVGHQISEMLRLHRGLSQEEARKRSVELMDRVQIPLAVERANDYPHQFSGGMCQRVMIAMALALDPDVLIADEPTTALDVTIQAQVMQLLSELQTETGMGIILITHDMSVIADVADRVVVMYAGRVVETGSIYQIFDQPAHPYTVGLMNCVPRLDRKEDNLNIIPGSPPNPINLPAGCAFHPRCPLARERCLSETPVSAEVGPYHQSACHFFEEVLVGL